MCNKRCNSFAIYEGVEMHYGISEYANHFSTKWIQYSALFIKYYKHYVVHIGTGNSASGPNRKKKIKHWTDQR